MATNPMIPQGTINRVRGSIVVPSFPALNVTAGYLSKKLITLMPETNAVEQEDTVTGFVNNPEVRVPYTITVGLLRTQSLFEAWQTQMKTQAPIGRIVVHSDTSAFPAVTVHNVSILKCTPGQFGVESDSELLMRGYVYVNNYLWNLL